MTNDAPDVDTIVTALYRTIRGSEDPRKPEILELLSKLGLRDSSEKSHSLDNMLALVRLMPHFDNLQWGYAIIDSSGNILYHNTNFVDTIGKPVGLENLEGMHVFDDFPFEVADQKTRLLEEAVEETEYRRSSGVKYSGGTGHEKYLDIGISPLPGYDAVAIGIMDVTKRVLESTIDGLTGLLNRRGYDDIQIRSRAERKKRESDKEDYGTALLFLDINNFKTEVNDKYDHAFGNDILTYVAEALNKFIPRKTDSKCRVGGDEFVVVLDNFGHENPYEYLKHLTAEINGFIQEQIAKYHSDKESNVNVSIGMSIYGKDAHTKEELYQHADNAMYIAKGNSLETVTRN